MKNALFYLCLMGLFTSACGVTGARVSAGGKCTTNADCDVTLQCLSNLCIGSAASDGGTSSGSGGNAGATAGSSAGGSSAGASSGSSSGGTAGGGSKLRFVNASPATSPARTASGLDLCVKATTDASFGAHGIVGGTGVAYGTASDLITSLSASVKLRVQAAGGNCGESAKLYDLPSAVDLSDSGTFTIVASGDEFTTVNSITKSESVKPTSTANGRLNLVHALSNEASVTATVPSATLASTLTAGNAHGAEVSPFSNQTLTLTGSETAIGHVFLFDGISLPAGAQHTIIALGDADEGGTAKAPKLLVCDDTQATSGCAAVSSEPQAYLRFADMSDATDATAQAVTLCMSAHGANTFTAIATASFNVGLPAVTGFKTYKLNAASYDLAVVPASVTGGTTLVPGACAGTALVSVNAQTLTAGAYTTAAFTLGNTLTFVHTRPAPTVANTVALTFFNGLASAPHTAFGPVNATLPELFNKPLASNVAASAFGTGDLPTAYLSELSARALRVSSTTVAGNGAVARISTDITVPVASTSVSIWSGGEQASDAQVFVCADDGSADGSGNSNCAAFATSHFSGVPFGFIRVANLGGVVAGYDLCINGVRSTHTLNVGNGQVSAFEQLDFSTNPPLRVTPHSDSCVGSSSILATGSTADGLYLTVFVVGDTTVAASVHAQTPPTPNQGSLSANLVEAWDGSTSGTLAVGSTPAGTATFAELLGASYTPVALPQTQLTFAALGAKSGTFTYDLTLATAAPALAGGVYDAMAFTKDVGHPQVLWCNDEMVNGSGFAVCDALIAQ